MSISGPAAVSEAAGMATYTVTCGDTPNPVPLLPAIPNTGTLNVGITDGPSPATQAADYGAPTQTLLVCSIATTEFTFDVPIVSDTADEANERFTVTASGTLVAEGPVSQGVTTTITDDDPIATITPLVRVTEGDSGTSVAELTVTLASAAAQATTIAFATEAASASPGSDFSATSGNLVIGVGQTTGTISIPIVGDTVPEPPEAFFVNLGTTDNGTLSTTQKQGIVAIFDNDSGSVPTVSLPKTVSVKENDGNALFAVTLSSPATARTEVSWKTINWTATTADYEKANGKLVFQPGQRTKTISVDLTDDRRDEPDEAFGVILENPIAAALGQKGSFGLIADDDGPKVKIGKPKVRGKRLVTTIGCPDTASGCEGTLVGKAGKLRLGRKAFNLDKGETKKLRLKMSKRARRKLAKRALRAKLKATASDTSGDTRVVKRRARLKRRR
jgi:hypothetical protein